MHPDLKLIVKQNVEMGLTSVPYLRKVLQQHVKTNLFSPDMIHPAQTDRSYYPTSRDIYNFIHQYLASGSFSGLAQENLEHKIDEWKGNTYDMFFFRPCSGSKPNTKSTKNAQRVLPALESEDEEEEEDGIGNARESSDISSNEKNTFLFVHQTENQKKILDKYGKFVLIDATYKTSKYALPLFLVVVRTNVKYVPIGKFIVESENGDNISEAISILKKWNPNWEPQFFMMDYSEFQAVHQEFAAADKFLCIFHIEQAWLRWTKKRKSNLTDDEAAEFLKLMREVLRSSTQENYETAVSNLQKSSIYSKENVQRYLDRYWLSIPDRWCRAFIDAGFNSMLRTNNGVEALNSSLKNYYTKLTGTGTITNLVETIVSDFIPDQINSFCYSSQYRQYNTHVPDFLRNLPRNVVKHCLLRYASAMDYSNDDIDEVSMECCL